MRWMRTGGAALAAQSAEAERAAVRNLAMSGALKNLEPQRPSGSSLLGALAAGIAGGLLTNLFD